MFLALIGAAGMTSVSMVTPLMGQRMDALGPGSALQMIAMLAAILAVIFAGVWLYFKAMGGYRAAHMSTVSAK